MTSDTPIDVSKRLLWTGRFLSGLVALFLLLDGAMKLVKPRPVLEATARLGYSESGLVGLGLVLICCTVLYVIPRTAVLGVILLTGYLGGAVASHVRIGDAPFPVLFPAILGALLWLGLVLRDDRVKRLLFRR
jgi:DoxX-like family